MNTAQPWPADHHYLSSRKIENLQQRCETSFSRTLSALRVPAELNDYLASFYIPLAAWLERAHRANNAPLIVGVCGGQGSGKSTLCSLLCQILESAFALRSVTLSIDDIYKTRAERKQLAAEAHPLFATRGVPGTHDVALGMKLLDGLSQQVDGEQTSIPVFDKAADTRAEPDRWRTHDGPTDIILFEGWCVGAQAQDDKTLREPVNTLERDEDTDGSWRTAVNEALKNSYAGLFARLDLLVLLEVDDFQRVFEWRQLQEHKLAERLNESDRKGGASSAMNDAEVVRFIMHYERITKHILSEMPDRADLVVHLDATHNARRTTVRRKYPRYRANHSIDD